MSNLGALGYYYFFFDLFIITTFCYEVRLIIFLVNCIYFKHKFYDYLKLKTT